MNENEERPEQLTEEELATVSGGTGGCDPVACFAKNHGRCIGGVCHPAGMGN
ncbi:MAG TPA: bacteriocin [Bryobacteraceae bacterium]|nr:bacteriocin [Bryobacteraceae bacterium]